MTHNLECQNKQCEKIIRSSGSNPCLTEILIHRSENVNDIQAQAT